MNFYGDNIIYFNRIKWTQNKRCLSKMNRTLYINNTAGSDPIQTGWSFRCQQRRIISLEATPECLNPRALLSWLLLYRQNEIKEKARTIFHHLFPCSRKGTKLPLVLHFMALPTEPTKSCWWKCPLWGRGLIMSSNNHRMLSLRILIGYNRSR